MIDINSPVNIIAGNEYSFYFSGGANSGEQVYLAYEIPGSYNDGDIIFDGSVNAGGDLIFKVVQGAGVSNSAPSLTGLPTDITATEDTESNLDISAASFSDLEGDNLTVTLSVNAGTFTSPVSGGGVTATLVNSSQITLQGSANAINTYLDTVSNIKYTGDQNANGDNVATLTISATDGTDSMSQQTVNIDITPVNDAPHCKPSGQCGCDRRY